jgi:tripartite-type tricarboxylate transporter receptor subunit TctC
MKRYENAPAGDKKPLTRLSGVGALLRNAGALPFRAGVWPPRAGTLLLSVGALLLLPFAQASAAYPDRPITLIVPYGPGGGVDIVARALAVGLGKQLKQSVVVANRPGGGGTIATAYVSRSTPDGYTLLIGDVSALTISPNLYTNLTYRIDRDFKPITEIAASTLDIALHPSVKATTVRELIDYARANPGKLNYSSPGNGTVPHLAAVLFETMTHTQMTHIPYKSGAEAVTALLGNQVQLSFAQVPLTATMANSGRVRILGVSSETRSPLLPKIPTIGEAGVPGYQVTSWVAAMAPAGTPDGIVKTLYNATTTALKDKETRDALVSAGFDVIGSTSAELAKLVAADARKWAQVIKTAGISVQ